MLRQRSQPRENLARAPSRGLRGGRNWAKSLGPQVGATSTHRPALRTVSLSDPSAVQPDEDPVVSDEEGLLARVRAHLATLRPSRPPPTADYEEQLLVLRDQIAVSRLEDVPALVQQMERLQGIAARRAEAVAPPVDPASPYFGH